MSKTKTAKKASVKTAPKKVTPLNLATAKPFKKKVTRRIAAPSPAKALNLKREIKVLSKTLANESTLLGESRSRAHDLANDVQGKIFQVEGLERIIKQLKTKLNVTEEVLAVTASQRNEAQTDLAGRIAYANHLEEELNAATKSNDSDMECSKSDSPEATRVFSGKLSADKAKKLMGALSEIFPQAEGTTAPEITEIELHNKPEGAVIQ